MCTLTPNKLQELLDDGYRYIDTHGFPINKIVETTPDSVIYEIQYPPNGTKEVSAPSCKGFKCITTLKFKGSKDHCMDFIQKYIVGSFSFDYESGYYTINDCGSNVKEFSNHYEIPNQVLECLPLPFFNLGINDKAWWTITDQSSRATLSTTNYIRAYNVLGMLNRCTKEVKSYLK